MDELRDDQCKCAGKEISAAYNDVGGPVECLRQSQAVVLQSSENWVEYTCDGICRDAVLLTDLITLFQLVDDNKLLNALGKNTASAKPKLAEAWRSARSARDIQLNLKAAREMTDVFAHDLKPADRAKLDKALNTAMAAANALPNDLGAAAADPKRRSKLETARTTIKAAQAAITAILPPALGVNLGFNALDSD